jgi:hypothetical protein
MFLQQLNCYKVFILTPIGIKRRKVVGRVLTLNTDLSYLKKYSDQVKLIYL